MYEPITVVKVRKETKITVPAGGWVLIGQPDEPLHSQIARRAKLVKDGLVNDDYSTLLIGRLQSTHPTTNFQTTEQAKNAAATKAARDKELTEQNEEAIARQKNQVAAAQKTAAEKHAENLKRINAQNDAIRNRNADVPEIKTPVQLATNSPVVEPDDFKGKTDAEIIEVAKGLKLELPSTATRQEVIAAIVKATEKESKQPGFLGRLFGKK